MNFPFLDSICDEISGSFFSVSPHFIFDFSGCVNAPPRDLFPDLRYSHLKPIGLAVNSVEIKISYVSPKQIPNVEHKFPIAPTKAASNWLEDRIRAEGELIACALQ